MVIHIATKFERLLYQSSLFALSREQGGQLNVL
jgi:hypothetical protein